ncbi:flagellar hook-length control protein FliK [Halomonas sp. V046]|uniref:flagellar hook-length control protein FliK n=1 Tax=Halomonas sp. V046 TaxID=3459611 RepID=UPI0040439531
MDISLLAPSAGPAATRGGTTGTAAASPGEFAQRLASLTPTGEQAATPPSQNQNQVQGQGQGGSQAPLTGDETPNLNDRLGDGLNDSAQGDDGNATATTLSELSPWFAALAAEPQAAATVTVGGTPGEAGQRLATVADAGHAASAVANARERLAVMAQVAARPAGLATATATATAASPLKVDAPAMIDASASPLTTALQAAARGLRASPPPTGAPVDDTRASANGITPMAQAVARQAGTPDTSGTATGALQSLASDDATPSLAPSAPRTQGATLDVPAAMDRGLGEASTPRGAETMVAGAASPATAHPTASNPTLAQATLTAPLASQAWNTQLGSVMARLGRTDGHGEQRIELRLNPAELGPLTVSLRLGEHGAHAQFLSAQAPVRQAVEQAIPQLREALEEQGISLGEASVSDHGQGQQERFAEARQSGGPGGPITSSQPGADVGAERGATDSRPAVALDGRVDLYA